MFLLLTILEIVGFSFLFVFILSFDLWLEILLSIIISIALSLLIRFVVLVVLANIFYKAKPNSKFIRFYAKATANFLRQMSNVSCKYEGRENLTDGPFVLFPNHKSLTDFLCVYVGTNKKMGFVAKKELLNNYYIKRFGKGIDCVFVDRENDRSAAESIIQAIKNVKSGTNMCIFPEGTRTDGREMLEGRAGAYKIAIKSKAAIIPVSIKNSHVIRFRSPWRRTKVILKYHKPIMYEEYKDMNTQDLEKKVRDIINEELLKG